MERSGCMMDGAVETRGGSGGHERRLSKRRPEGRKRDRRAAAAATMATMALTVTPVASCSEKAAGRDCGDGGDFTRGGGGRWRQPLHTRGGTARSSDGVRGSSTGPRKRGGGHHRRGGGAGSTAFSSSPHPLLLLMRIAAVIALVSVLSAPPCDARDWLTSGLIDSSRIETLYDKNRFLAALECGPFSSFDHKCSSLYGSGSESESSGGSAPSPSSAVVVVVPSPTASAPNGGDTIGQSPSPTVAPAKPLPSGPTQPQSNATAARAPTNSNGNGNGNGGAVPSPSRSYTPAPVLAPGQTYSPTLSYAPTSRITEWWEKTSHAGTSRPTLQPTTAEYGQNHQQCPPDVWYPYKITLFDKWGDGWDGAYLIIDEIPSGGTAYQEYQTGSSPGSAVGSGVIGGGINGVSGRVYDGAIVSGFKSVDTFCLRALRCYRVTVAGGGPWMNEVSWRIDSLDVANAVRLSDAFRAAMTQSNGDVEERVAYGYGSDMTCTFGLGTDHSLPGCPWTCQGRVPPTPMPTSRPTPNPTPTPTDRPTFRPTQMPTPRPTPRPTPNPTPRPTTRPTYHPTPTFAPVGVNETAAPRSRHPTMPPRPRPVVRPTRRPTARPTTRPSPRPTIRPTTMPSPNPTSKPTTVLQGLYGPRPYKPPGYYSYSPFDPHYGPKVWHELFPSCRSNGGLSGFLEFQSNTFGKGGVFYNNIGSNGSPGSGPQSPIILGREVLRKIGQGTGFYVDRRGSVKIVVGYGYDLVRGTGPSAVTRELYGEGYGSGENARCYATHEIRTRAANFDMCDPEQAGFAITPTRLRLNFLDKSSPVADLPDGYGDLNAKYLEVTYPSLHVIEMDGTLKRYDAEYTIAHLFERQGKVVMVSILIDASGPYNGRFQDLLDGWSTVTTCTKPQTAPQVVYGTRRAQDDVSGDVDAGGNNAGGNHSSEERREKIRPFYASSSNATRDWEAGVGGEDRNSTLSSLRDRKRRLSCIFNVYHRTLMTTAYFYTYTGSLVEPPCTAHTDWRVMAKPMKISAEQLEQVKSLLLEGPCKGDPYSDGQWEGGFARPIQKFERRPFWQCRRNDFPMDCERDNGYCDCDAVLCPQDY